MEDLSEFDKKVLYLLDNNLMSISEVSEKLEMDRQFIKGILESLRYRGYLKATKVGRSIVYTITKRIEQ